MKTINANKISNSLITEYIKDSSMLFCQDCRDLKPKSEMWVQYYVNGLYGYTCLDCEGGRRKSQEPPKKGAGLLARPLTKKKGLSWRPHGVTDKMNAVLGLALLVLNVAKD